MNTLFRKAIGADRHIPDDSKETLSNRAEDNLRTFYSLLRSTGEEGVEDLIRAIHASSFTTCRSHSHHHYTTGTLEHSLGVYRLMMPVADSEGLDRNSVILTALLHDVGKGFHGIGGHHPERSSYIVKRYLPNVSGDVLSAIRHHQHHSRFNRLQNLVCDADHRDASTCNSLRSFLSSIRSDLVL